MSNETATATPATSFAMVQHYIQMLTVGWFDPEDLPPDEVSGYASRLADVRSQLERWGDAEPFRLGLAYLLASPSVDLSRVAGSRYPYDGTEVREILEYMWHELYGTPIPTAAPVMAWTDDSLIEDWWARRGRLHRIRPGDTLRSIAADSGVPLETLLTWNPYYRERYRPDAALPLSDRVVRLVA